MKTHPSSEREFERLYRESYELVYNYVRCRMRDDGAVEDVVAETYLRAARSFSRFDPARAKFTTWAVAIANNCMNDYWRQSRQTTSIDDVPEGCHASRVASGVAGWSVGSDLELSLELRSSAVMKTMRLV